MIPNSSTSRREFLARTALAGSALLTPLAWSGCSSTSRQGGRRTAADQVHLGRTGVRCSRLGIGTGSNSGNVQRALGRDGFNRLLRHAYDLGITYIDTAQSYQAHEWIRDALKGLPREKLYLQTKISGASDNPLAVIDGFRKELGTDYIDSLLIHCATKPDWDAERRRTMDAVSEAQARGWVRLKGVSCHSLPALSRAVDLPWVELHLVRVNPQGAHIDTPAENWDAKSNSTHLEPVINQIRSMRQQGRGIIGMKLVGNGDFTNAADREQAMRYAMRLGLLDAVVIGFKSPAEIEESIDRMNRALAEA